MISTLLLPFFVAFPPIEGPTILPENTPSRVVVLSQLSARAQTKMPMKGISQEQGETVLRFYLLRSDKTLAGPMLGTYERKEGLLSFRPLQSLLPGMTYRAQALGDDGGWLSADYKVPDPPKTKTTVQKITPGGPLLPANVLRFTIQFSGPMQGGSRIFDEIFILDDKGKEIVDPWLRDELWSDRDTRLILYIHPGRIKWGVLLRESLGPVLEPNRDYSLVLKGSLRDANGNPLGKDVVYKFKTGPEIRSRIELGAWQWTLPEAGTMDPVRIQFPHAMDHKSLERFLSLEFQGKEFYASRGPGLEEKSWFFRPYQPWQAGEYVLKVDPQFEDIAGNTPIRPFDLDLKTKMPPPQNQRLSFQIR